MIVSHGYYTPGERRLQRRLPPARQHTLGWHRKNLRRHAAVGV